MLVSRCYGILRNTQLPTSLSHTARITIIRCKSSAVVPELIDPDKPIKFSTSPAGWNYKKIEYYNDHPWYKIVILWGSLFSLLHYLMFYREGNDIDDELDMPLGKRYLWIQELHLLDEKRKLLSQGHDGSSVDEELNKIKALRKKYNYE